MNEQKFQPIIGLEIHVELRTKSKMFCGCNASWFGKKPNTLCCPVCLGLPGALPVPNKKAIEWTVMLGLALSCKIPLFSKFDRKNYFYPDLPKGYQISQYDKPFARNGVLKLKVQNSKFKVEEKTVRIRRVHMEEDTGKLLHATIDGEKCTLIDFNRSGVPLVEIVTEPDIRSSEEAKIFLKKVHQIIRYLGISDADMEKGSMRIEPNISVLKVQSSKLKINTLPKYKVEIKNINSFNFTKKAIDYEISRQIRLLQQGRTPVQETRGWDEKKEKTYFQRGKEEAHDYRYFPEPDIPPIRWSELQISNLKLQIPELPDKKMKRLMKKYQLSEYDTSILTEDRVTADYFEKTVKYGQSTINNQQSTIKNIANWIINKKADIAKVSPQELLKLIAKQSQKPTISDGRLEEIIKKVIAQNPKAVSDYKSGKTQALMFLLGQVMRQTKGKGKAERMKKLLQKLLSN